MRAVYILLALCAMLLASFFVLQHIIAEREAEPVRLADAGGMPLRTAAEPTVREPAVAGAFYPQSAAELRSAVERYVADAGTPELPGKPIGVIAPHAGYVYSGHVAGHSYAALKGHKYDTVVVVGPSHGASFSGAALPEVDQWETPLGVVPIAKDLRDKLTQLDPRFQQLERVMAREHSLEVQVPFLQVVLSDFDLLPIQVADYSPANLAAIAQALASATQGTNTLLVASTDMSHYPAYDEAVKADKDTLALMRSWRLRDLIKREKDVPRSGVPELHCALCGLGPVLAVMDASSRLGANQVSVLKYANSGDVPVGDKNRCVGYCAVALCRNGKLPAATVQPIVDTEASDTKMREIETSEGELNEEQQKYLLELARKTIDAWVTSGKRTKPDRREGIFAQDRAVFVTLNEHGELRGCIGSLTAREPLVDAVVSRAIAAATEDPRFRPVAKQELSELSIHVSVLSPSRKVDSPSEIELGKHGIIVKQGFRTGVFLPEVAPEQGWDLETTLRHLCSGKAGLSPDAWQSGAELYVFTTQSFGDVE